MAPLTPMPGVDYLNFPKHLTIPWIESALSENATRTTRRLCDRGMEIIKQNQLRNKFVPSRKQLEASRRQWAAFLAADMGEAIQVQGFPSWGGDLAYEVLKYSANKIKDGNEVTVRHNLICSTRRWDSNTNRV